MGRTKTTKTYYSPAEIAEQVDELGITEAAIRRMCRDGQLTHHRGPRGRIALTTQALDEIEALTVRQAESRSGLEVVADQHDAPAPDPFRSTARSRAAHARKSA